MKAMPWVRSLPSAADIKRSYEEAFDCDFVVDARNRADDQDYPLVSFAQLRTGSQWAATDAGLSVFPIYARVWRDEFRFESRRTPRVAVPHPPSDALGSFVEVCFGRFFNERADVEERYRGTFDAEDLTISPDNLLEGFPATAREPFLGPLAVGQYGVTYFPFGPRVDPQHDTIVVVVDSDDPVDLFDLWNIRASGANAVAIPTIWEATLAQPVASRLSEQRGTESKTVRVYRGRRSTENTGQALMDALSAAGLSPWPCPPPVASPFFGYLNAALAEAGRDEIDVAASRGLVEVPLLAPRLPNGRGTGMNAWMNTVTIRSWTLPRDGSVAPFIPSLLGDATRLLGPFAPPRVRAGKRGLEFSSSSQGENVTIRPPSGRAVVDAVLRHAGFDPRASDAGIVAERLISQMGSLRETALLRHRDMLRLLNKAALSGVEMLAGEGDGDLRVRVGFIKRAELMRVIGRAFGARHADSVLQQLVDRNVLRLGLTLRCDACGYMNWLELDSVRRTLRCDRCLTDYAFPEASPPDIGSWAYKPTGACGVENYARGSYTVAQVLRVLEPLAEPMIWCTGTRLDETLEVDLVAVRKRSNDVLRLIFGEAKTLGPFKPRDFARANRVMRGFKDSTFVFATMRDRLTRDELSQLRKLVRPRARSADDVPNHARILVLTALELSGVGRPPDSWRQAGGRIAGIVASAERYAGDDVDVWADVTMQIHVGLGPHAEWSGREVRRLARNRTRRQTDRRRATRAA